MLHTRSTLFITAAAVMTAAFVGSANAALITFGSSSDLTNNFRDLTTSGSLAASGGTLNVSNTASSRVIVYDTTPTDATAGTRTTFNAVTTPVSVSFDLSSVTTNGASIGVYFIDAAQAETANASGLVLLNVDNTAGAELVRVTDYRQPTTGDAANLATISSVDLGIGVNQSPKTITATYTRTNAQFSTLSLTIGSTTVSGIRNNFWAPANVQIGLRLFPGSSGSYSIDNFNVVVPEHASLGLGGIATAILGRRRRA
jgi:hypothetical protein